MDDALLVSGLERFRDLTRDRRSPRRAGTGPRFEPLGEVLALDQLHGEEVDGGRPEASPVSKP